MADLTNSTRNHSGTPTPSNSIHELSHEIELIGDRDVLQEGLHQAADWLDKNQKMVKAVVLAIFLAMSGYLGFNWLQSKLEQRAQEDYYKVEKPLLDLQRDYALGKRAETVKDADKAAQPKGKTASGDLEKDYGSALKAVESYALANKGKQSAAEAALFVVQIAKEYAAFDRALAVVSEVRKSYSIETTTGGMLAFAEANLLAESKKYDAAVSIYEKILQAKELKAFTAEAALRAGICLAELGQKDRAIETLKKAESEGEKTSAAQASKNLRRRLEIGS